MNLGTSSTELNDMLTDFVDYVDSFYGLSDPIYPMTYKDTGLPLTKICLLYTSPSPRDRTRSRMPSSA